MILALITSLACVSLDVDAKEGATLGNAETGTQAAPPPPPGMKVAVFAGGCFWCMEGPLESVKGVSSVTSGYTGGKELHPTYEDVGYNRTTHYEANRVVYDPTVVSYAELLQVYWHNIDPTQSNGQFCDRGDQYRSAVFTSDPEEITAFKQSKTAAAAELNETLVTPVLPEAVFWIGETYHQDYYKTHPTAYMRYRKGCGRDARLEQLWGPGAVH